MDREKISDLIEEKNAALINWLESQADEKWQDGPTGKWTTGQHALHLLQSIKPLNNALSMPKFLLRFKFGKQIERFATTKRLCNAMKSVLKMLMGIPLGLQ